jgi:hypothetical protein
MKEIRIEDEAEIAAQAEAEIAPPSVPDLVSLTTEELKALREYLDLGGSEDEKVERYLKTLSGPLSRRPRAASCCGMGIVIPQGAP